MKEKIIIAVISYLKNLTMALLGKTKSTWKVFYIGELGVRQLNFPASEFFPTNRLFLKAEKTSKLPEGQINDVYNQMILDEEALVAIYCKEFDV